jgi:hypothetical protein
MPESSPERRSSASEPPLPNGARVSEPPGYQILAELGRGAMGVVYRARQLKLNRLVALKMILAGGHAGPEELARFRTEAEAIARLQHPNIVQIHEVGEHEGRPFFSLEFCPGGSLERQLASTPVLPGKAAALTEQLARAMAAVHQKGVIWYRLPSEAEWEYACRGGATSLEECSYHFYLGQPTNDLSSEQANFDGNRPFGKAPKGPHLQRTTRVGAYPSNKLGLCDMHGNVGQWTDTAEGSDQVTRGHGCYLDGSRCQAAYRIVGTPTVRYSYLGFRLARAPVR